MKKMRKILAMVMAFALVLGMTIGVNAATKKPEASDTAIATIKNVEADASIKVYQLVDARYNDKGFVEYVRETGVTSTLLPDIENYTYAQVMALAKLNLPEYDELEDTENTAVEWTYDADNKQYTTRLEAGMYLVKISATNAKVYNPIIIGIGYDKTQSGSTNELKTGTVGVDTDEWTLSGTTVSAKSSDITATKDVKDAEAEVGGTVEFTINTTIPSYSSDNESVTFSVIDTIINGLEYATANGNMVAPVVKVNNVELDAANYTFTPGDKTFTIAFKSDYVLGLADKTDDERAVVITYDAIVTEDAIEEVGENKVSLNYTTVPGQTTTKDKDWEYVYTVTLDGVFDKVKEDEVTALNGATFELYRAVDRSAAVVDTTVDVTEEELNSGYSVLNGNYVKYFGVSTSVGDGSLLFEGLDADETYYLKETIAPNGYTLNDHVYTISFANLKDIDNDDIYDQYDVLVDGENKGTIKYGSSLDADDAVSGNMVTLIPNTQMIDLPSTGGIGTTIFTVAGCVIMIAAAFFFIVSRKKEEN